jgi:glutathione S-transferase
MLALGQKAGVRIETHGVFQSEHKTPAYLQLNQTRADAQRRRFCYLRPIAIRSCRSHILSWLYGKTPEETGLVWQTISECESYLVGEGNKIVRPVFFGKGLDKVEEIQQAAQTIREELKSVDARLARSNWLVGGQISAADITVFPVVQLLLRAASKEAAQPLNLGLMPLSQTYPNLARWVRQIEALPGYERTYPPHWR